MFPSGGVCSARDFPKVPSGCSTVYWLTLQRVLSGPEVLHLYVHVGRLRRGAVGHDAAVVGAVHHAVLGALLHGERREEWVGGGETDRQTNIIFHAWDFPNCSKKNKIFFICETE